MNDDHEDGEPNGVGEGWTDADGPPPAPVDPGRPSAENVAFVLMGALLALFVFGRVAGLV